MCETVNYRLAVHRNNRGGAENSGVENAGVETAGVDRRDELHFPPLLCTAFSTLAMLPVSHFPLPHFQSPRNNLKLRSNYCC